MECIQLGQKQTGFCQMSVEGEIRIPYEINKVAARAFKGCKNVISSCILDCNTGIENRVFSADLIPTQLHQMDVILNGMKPANRQI